MIKWIKDKLFQDATADEIEEIPDEVNENFAPVGVRVNSPEAVRVKPANTYVDGYNVDESEIGADDDHPSTVNNIKTTGVDPYNTGRIDLSDVEKSVPEE